MQAYDIEMLTRPVDRADPADKGWCFGLPPGIEPEQWPLDRDNGFPLMHAFTMLLPDDYRCHGPETVALSVFGTACDHNDGGPEYSKSIAEALAPDAPEATDPELVALQAAHRRHHPRAHWMEDILGGFHSLILLTAEEYSGPPCWPPELVPCIARDKLVRPRWLDIGSAAAMWTLHFPRWETQDHERYFLYRFLGGVPDFALTYSRAVRVRPRALDPNAGVPTCDRRDPHQTGYISPYFVDDTGAHRERDWRACHGEMNIGGTMRTSQNVPRFSPYHLGFPEEFGGYNFGGGRAARLQGDEARLGLRVSAFGCKRVWFAGDRFDWPFISLR